MPYKLHVSDRNYEEWSVYDTLTMSEIEPPKEVNPICNKLISNDIFEIKDGVTKILHSSTRSVSQMPGVLLLEKNKTYGRCKQKLLYKCIPDDKRLPIFLIPHIIKKIGFSKKMVNKYVTFKFNNWDSKHPQGTIVSVLGGVDNLSNFYEYQLYCHSLYASIQGFTRATSQSLKKKSHLVFIDSILKEYPLIEDRQKNNIMSIDPPKSGDFDDAFEIIELSNTKYKLSIYIANVPLWMEVLNLWDSFSQRISTIYLPDRKRPMLPTILSDCLCSLQENETRFAFTLDMEIEDGKIISTRFLNTAIRVSKNYRYEEEKLQKDDNYKLLFDVVQLLNKNYKYMSRVRNSHDLVSYLMILMNYKAACEMIKYNDGIYRSVVLNKKITFPDTLSEDVSKFLKIWNSASGQYALYDKKQQHEFLELESYIHISSPIRRLVDLLNMMRLQTNLGLINYSKEADTFYDNWVEKLDYINTTMRSIRKIQYDCSLLDMCVNEPRVMEKNYDGYVFDKIVRNDGLFQYLVYLPKLKMLSRIALKKNVENYANLKFKLYLFLDEANLKRKIRLHLID